MLCTMAAKEYTTLEVDGCELRLSSPGKVFWPPHDGRPEITKLDLAQYYLSVADATVNHLRERPTTLKRFKDGITGEFFFQKRVPEKRPDWLQTATVSFPSGRSATELVPNDAAHLVWAVNLGNIDWNPWPVRRADLDHPDELRIDLDPTPGVAWDDVRRVALAVDELLGEMQLTGYPKTSGSRARSSAACRTARRASGGRRSVAASSSTTTRTRATAPSRGRAMIFAGDLSTSNGALS
jgi:bifunctional non-homologous end joining protein LigD